MVFRRMSSLTLAAIFAFGLSACAPGDSKPAPAAASVNDLLQAMRVEEQLTGGDNMADMVIKANPALGPFRDVLTAWADKTINWTSMGPEVTVLYEKAFTPEERAEIVAFYQTKTGQRLLEEMPKLAASGSAIGMRLGEANQAELQRMLSERALQLKHPGAAAPDPDPASPQ